MPTGDPVTALVHLMAAQDAGCVPVLAGPGWDVSARDRVLAAARAVDDPAARLVVLTSGSSGDPRAVVRTVRSWDASVDAFTRVAGLVGTDVVWLPGGVDSTLTLFGLWHALVTGLPAVATGGWRASGPVPATASVVHCVPTVAADVLDRRRDGALPALRRAVLAGAGGVRALRRRAAPLGVDVVEYYGAAELSFVAVDADGAGLRPFPGVEVVAREGVVHARSAYLSEGYFGGDGPLRRDADGWATVGDRGEVRPDGTLTVEGRGEDGLSVGGHTVVVSDVERVLAGVDGVVEVVCLGEPHARLGERVVAVVRPREGVDPVPALRAAARSALPAPARPVRYVVLAELPRTSGGKVARAVLREKVTTAGRTGGR